jgi:serine/threonine protein kinase SCH9
MTDLKVRNRQGASDDDGTDQIGSDTPRSGVATPQPDLHDKRLPGIMSYFGQVRSKSLSLLYSSSSSAQAQDTEIARPASPQEEKEDAMLPEQLPSPDAAPAAAGQPLLPHERVTPPADSESTQQQEEDTRQQADQNKEGEGASQINPYPTPPCSQTPSERGLNLSDASGDATDSLRRASLSQAFLNRKSVSELPLTQSRRASVASPLTNVVTASSAVGQLSNPTGRNASTTPSSPSTGQSPTEASGSYFSSESASVDRLKKLTNDGSQKSGPPTPTRALSSTQTSQTEEKPASRQNSDNSESIDSGAQTPVSAQTGGARAPNVKGKLTIKILEGRGLRKSRDPYVVVVFQRSELISSGPRTFEDEDELTVPPVSVGGIPIQRQSSDSGRPMAIPMRSRQSSNTSVGDYNTFRNRTRRMFTSPRWDAEAVLYVFDGYPFGSADLV